jgi:hypothetical protein
MRTGQRDTKIVLAMQAHAAPSLPFTQMLTTAKLLNTRKSLASPTTRQKKNFWVDKSLKFQPQKSPET